MKNLYQRVIQKNYISEIKLHDNVKLSIIKKILLLYGTNYKFIRKYLGGYWICHIENTGEYYWYCVEKSKINNVCCGYSYKNIFEFYPLNFFGNPEEFHNNYSNIIKKEKLNRILN